LNDIKAKEIVPLQDKITQINEDIRKKDREIGN
jgi:hypothetical protein